MTKFAGSIDCSNLTPSDHVIWNDVAGELILFDSSDGSYHALNEVGSYLWRNIAHGRELSLIIKELSGQYKQDETTIKADVHHFLSEALAKGLLHVKDAPL
jgi:hypothetical protein